MVKARRSTRKVKKSKRSSRRRSSVRGGNPSGSLVIYAGPTPGTFTTTAPPAVAQPACPYVKLGNITLKVTGNNIAYPDRNTFSQGDMFIGPRGYSITNPSAYKSEDGKYTGPPRWQDIGAGVRNERTMFMGLHTKTIEGADIAGRLRSMLSTDAAKPGSAGDFKKPVYLKITSADNTSEVVLRVQLFGIGAAAIGMASTYSGTGVGILPSNRDGSYINCIVGTPKGLPQYGKVYTLSIGQCNPNPDGKTDTVPQDAPPAPVTYVANRVN